MTQQRDKFPKQAVAGRRLVDLLPHLEARWAVRKRRLQNLAHSLTTELPLFTRPIRAKQLTEQRPDLRVGPLLLVVETSNLIRVVSQPFHLFLLLCQESGCGNLSHMTERRSRRPRLHPV